MTLWHSDKSKHANIGVSLFLLQSESGLEKYVSDAETETHLVGK